MNDMEPQDDVADLIAVERLRSGLPEACAEHVLRSVVAGAAADHVEPPSATPPPRAAPPARGASSFARAARSGALPTWAAAGFGLVCGVALGAGGYARLRPTPPPRIERVIERVEVPAAVRAEAAGEQQAPRSAPDVAGVRPEVRLSQPGPRSAPAREREGALMERARAALLHGGHTEALGALDQHARLYPRGRLAEEREVLAVQALLVGGQGARARTRAEAFLQTHPDSPLVDLVRPALRDR